MSALPNPPGGRIAYGITLYDVADNDNVTNMVFAFGHHDKRRFIAACSNHSREIWGHGYMAELLATYPPEEIAKHEYAEYRHLADMPRPQWTVLVGENKPGRVPVTVWHQA